MVTSIAFHPSETFLVFNAGREFQRLELATGVVTPLCDTSCPSSLARSDVYFLQGGDWLTGVSPQRGPVVFDWRTDEAIAKSEGGENLDRVNSHWTPDGKIVVTKPGVDRLAVHDMTSCKVLYQLPRDRFNNWANGISDNGRWIVSGNSQGEVIVWDREGIEKTLASFQKPASATTD